MFTIKFLEIEIDLTNDISWSQETLAGLWQNDERIKKKHRNRIVLTKYEKMILIFL